jgi:hypothetical protein
MNKNGYKSHIVITSLLCLASWLTTNLVAAHQYLSVYGSGTETIWQEAIKRSVDKGNFPYMFVFFIPLLTVALLRFSRYARMLWIVIALLMSALPFDAWNDASKEIIIDMEMYFISSFLLSVLAIATFLVLLIHKGLRRLKKKNSGNIVR